jgi:hypothetical protein
MSALADLYRQGDSVGWAQGREPIGQRARHLALQAARRSSRQHRRGRARLGLAGIADFQARYLTVDDIWIPLGESLLITKFRPVWNIALDGFGNHDPGKGRYEGLRPLWDHLHPGRPWAEKCAARTETVGEVVERIDAYLAAHPVQPDEALPNSSL